MIQSLFKKSGFCLLLLLILIFSQNNYSQDSTAKNTQTLPPLELNKTIEREIAAKEIHKYQITLAKNQFAFVDTEQLGIDVIVRVFNQTDDRALVQKDLMIKADGHEEVGFVGVAEGVYRLEIEAKPIPATATGRYKVRLAEVRQATEKELNLEEARKLHNDAILLYRAGKYSEAIPVSERSLAIREKELGGESLDVAASLANLALLNSNMGNYEKAITLQQRAIKIREKVYGTMFHPDITRTLGNMGNAYYFIGNYEEAIRIQEKVIEIEEKLLGAEHPEIANSVGNLGEFYLTLGNYTKAEELMRRGLAIKEKSFPSNSSPTAFSLSSIGTLYAFKGDDEKALEFHQRALAMWEKTSGPNHPNTALGLNMMASIYRGREDYKTAENYLLRSLEILQKAFKEPHPRVANTMGELAVLYNLWGDYPKAENYFQQTLQMFEKTYGKEHRNYALTVGLMASLYTNMGEYKKAEPLYEQAIVLTEKIFGTENPDLISYLNDFGRNYQVQGKTVDAIAVWKRAERLSEQKTKMILASSAEKQKLSHLNLLSGETNQYLSAHLKFAPDDATALNLALTTIFERKGRVADALATELAALRTRFSRDDQILLDDLTATTAQLARRILSAPANFNSAEYQKQIKDLQERKESLESDISRRSNEFRSQIQPVSVESIRAAIPKNTTLIEFSVYFPYDPKFVGKKAFGEPHYVAYLVENEGRVQWRDLGEKKVIDTAIDNLRQALRDSKRKDVKQLARLVDEKIMQPIRSVSGNARQLLISPDGDLNLVPFEALVDENGKYLIENYLFSYLTSGRDLLRMQTVRESKNKSVILANPDFGKSSVEQSSEIKTDETAGKRSVTTGDSLAETYFAPLSATMLEARSIKALFPEAEFLSGEQANETALKQMVAPRILHIATHGFFLQDKNSQSENPLLRSGLALTGANQRKSGTDDGILTALEASGLNLWGTKLVVLSACDTGVGEIKNGEGVYGLRRAFVLAGTETLMMSLWEVSDTVTRELMTDYYKNLKNGMGRSAALRQVQLEMLKKKGREHPFYWAAFIQSGEWANLDSKR